MNMILLLMVAPMKNVSSEGILGVRKTIQYSLEARTIQAIRIYAEMIIAYFLIFPSKTYLFQYTNEYSINDLIIFTKNIDT